MKKYWELSKNEKKKLKNDYYSTATGKVVNIRLFRLSLTGTIGILYSLYIITNNYINNQVDWTTWITSIPLLIASIFFVGASIYLRFKNLNKFALKEKK